MLIAYFLVSVVQVAGLMQQFWGYGRFVYLQLERSKADQLYILYDSFKTKLMYYNYCNQYMS